MEFKNTEFSDLLVDHRLEVNSLDGTARMSVPLRLTRGRQGFGPELSLLYGSRSNSAFGFRWSLGGVAAIGHDTRFGLPTYKEGEERFAIGGQSLVPFLDDEDGTWETRFEQRDGWRIERYRMRVERTYERIERWVRATDGRAHWVVRRRDGVVSVYGKKDDGTSRIADPRDPGRTFLWLLEAQYHPKGSAILYEYKAEDEANIDADAPHETHRFGEGSGFAQRYLKRILYGNSAHVAFDEPLSSEVEWRFEVVVDYGEHDDEPGQAYSEERTWPVRPDAFSNHRAGFEVRTYRRCRRLMLFHRFEALGDSPCLVATTVLEHDDDRAGSMLKRVYHRGYRRTEAGLFEEAQTPELILDYARAAVDQAFEPAPEETSVNLPAGIDGHHYRFFDLYGEGLPGLLMRRGGAWYYKENLGDGRFGALCELDELPSRLSSALNLQDFNGDGDPNLVTFAGREAGRYTRDRQKGRWEPYQTFASSVRADYANARPQWADLNGDGYPDLIIDRHDRFVWYPSRNGEEFDEPVEIAKPDGAEGGLPTLRRDGRRFFFADMTGDGLPDMVRVDNGRVQYWPNQGRGDFGEAVLMGNAPRFDSDDSFDPLRLHFVDLDRSGASDLLYLGRGELRWWRNLAGNGFDQAHTVRGLPYIDQNAAVQLVDFLGDGSRCLVWSSSLPSSEGRAISYLRLSSATPARTLKVVDNSCGRQTRLHHRLSTVDYLRDKRDGRDWHTKLPRHGPVVAEIETVDLIGGARRKTSYAYRDGRWDAEERRFCGFGQVDGFDLDPNDEDAPTAPMMWRTWHHVGAFDDFEARTAEFYDGDAEHMRLPPPRCVDSKTWTNAEHEDAFRALAGTIWRQEYYEVGADAEGSTNPLRVVEYAYELKRLQPSDGDRQAVFTLAQAEQLAHEYETRADDPRVTHQLQLEADDYGNVGRHLSIAYPRRDRPERLGAQEELLAELTCSTYVNFDDDSRYELGVETEVLAYEIKGLSFAGRPLGLDELREKVIEALDDPLSYDAPTGGAGVAARLLNWQRNHFWDDGLIDAAPAGQVGVLTLLHHVERALFPETMVSTVFGDRVDDAALTEAYLELRDGYWWATETTYHYGGAESFFRLHREQHADGGWRTIEFDDDWLIVTSTEDSLSNRVDAEIDFHQMAPWRITDANDNVAEVRYDPFGMTLARAIYGTRLGKDGSEYQFGDISVQSWTAPGGMTFADIANDPAALLGQATNCSIYDIAAFSRGEGPLRILTVEREEHINDGEGNTTSTARLTTTISYVDGFGRTLQSKTEAGDGEAIARDGSDEVVVVDGVVQHEEVARRWLTSGHPVYDDKGLLLRRYEPFFSANSRFEDDEALQIYGVATEISYDASGREVERKMADGSVTRIEYRPWSTTSWDANDAVSGSDWEAERQTLAPADPRRKALDDALAHADTPSTVHFDAAGRMVRTVERGEAGEERVTDTTFDLRGLPVSVVDPRGITAFSYQYDMLERLLLEESADAGKTWSLPDALGRTSHRWDERGVHIHHRFDLNGRLQEATVTDASGSRLVLHNIYGEDAPFSATEIKARNLRGQVFEVFDDAGAVSFERYDHIGQPLTKTREVRRNYDEPADWTDPTVVAMGPEVHVFETERDALGRPRERRLADGTTHRYDYAALGHVERVRVSTEDGVLSDEVFLDDAEYNARGQRTHATLGNGVELRHDFDGRSFRLKRLRVERPITTSSSTRRYLDVAYTYDPVGNITHWVDRIQEPTGGATALLHGASITTAREFTYDAYYQLVRSTGRVHQALQQHDYRQSAPGSERIKSTRHLSLNNGAALERYTRTYDYDLAGNLEFIRHQADSRTFKTELWTADDSNRSFARHSVDGVEFADPGSFFDENGNTLRLPHLERLEWDWSNRLARAVVVERGDGETDDAEYYVYGADAKRVRKVTERVVQGGVEITDVIYLDGCEIREVRRVSGVRLRRRTCHVTDGSSPIATLHQWDLDELGAETDDLAAKKIHYRVDNHLGSVVLELDDKGDVISYEEYFAYGGTSFIAGDSARDIKLKEYRYSGKLRDDTTGLYYYEYRYYAPFIGNWLSPDPAGPIDGLNLYRFVRNNPVRFIDPNGLESVGSEVSGPTVGVARLEDVPEVVRDALGVRSPEAFGTVDTYIKQQWGRDMGASWHTGQQRWVVMNVRLQENIDLMGGDVELGTFLYTMQRITDEMLDAQDISELADSIGSAETGGPGNADDDDDDEVVGGGATDGDGNTAQDDEHGPGTGDEGDGSGSGVDGDGQGAGGNAADEAAGEGDGREGDGLQGGGGSSSPGASGGSGRDGAQNGDPNAGRSDADGISGQGTSTDGQAEGSTSGDGNSSGDAPDGAQNLPPVPPGLPTSDQGIAYSPDIDPDLIREGGGGPGSSDQGDPRGAPGADEGSAQRPGGQQGTSPNGSPDGAGAGVPGGSPDGEGAQGDPAQTGRGLRGGVGDHELPWWLSWIDPALDVLQVGLDIVGLIPGVGEIADGINGVISLMRGDYLGASLSFAAMIPFAGWAATAGKFGRRAVNATGSAGGAVTRYGDEAATLATATTRNADEAAAAARRQTSDLPDGLAAGNARFTPTGDQFGRNASRAAPNGNFYDVIAHGTPNRIQVALPGGRTVMTDHRTAARLIQNQSGYQGQPIRLLSCNTGACPTGFAQNLSNKLGVDVIAPNRLIWAAQDGGLYIYGGIQRNNQLIMNLSDPGSFVRFTPGI